MDHYTFRTRPVYPPSTCTLRKGKYYVTVTVPKQIAPLFKTKQIRRSTGTSDPAAAKRTQHALTAEIYKHMDDVWNARLRVWEEHLKEDWTFKAKGFAETLGMNPERFDPERSRNLLEAEMHNTLRAHFGKGDDVPASELGAALHLLSARTEAIRLDRPKTPEGDTIAGVLQSYLEGRKWERLKTKDAAKRQIERFASMVGNLKLSEIEKSHAYDYAEAMHDTGYAHKTIRSSVSAVSALLDWCERTRLVKLSPFVNLKLANYGKATQSYRPFEKPELHQLFQLAMPAQERTLLSLLITTGMRLDEAALLTWERVKKVDGIRFISLIQEGSEPVVVKNTQSNRLIALPDCLKMPERTTGRLFDYRLDNDGKAENAASRALMKVIRQVTKDKMKVAHSLRGTLKDLLRDADISKEVNDFITGHSQGDEAGKYGSGPSLVTKYKAVNSVDHPWLNNHSPTEPT